MRSRASARSVTLSFRRRPSSRTRKYSSAIFSAARTESFRVSPAGDSIAARRIFSSTYAASSAT